MDYKQLLAMSQADRMTEVSNRLESLGINSYVDKDSTGGIDFDVQEKIANQISVHLDNATTEQYETVPSFKFNYKNKNSTEFNYNIKASIDKFEHNDNSLVEGTRYLVYPSIEMPLLSDGWEVTPKFGIRHIDYSLDNNTIDPKSKTTAIASLRGKLYFDKFVGDKLYTLEPEAYLLYIPVGNQDGNPLFDTGLKEFKYSLLSENKFYGEDRINDAKQISLALTHRIIDENSGDELFTGTIGQLIYFDDRDVHLTDNTKSHSDASNIIGL